MHTGQISRINFNIWIPGWNHHQQNICSYTFRNRSRRSRRNRCRTPPSGYSRCRSRHALHPHHLAITVPPRFTSSITRYRAIPPESTRWKFTSQPCHTWQSPRCFQPFAKPLQPHGHTSNQWVRESTDREYRAGPSDEYKDK